MSEKNELVTNCDRFKTLKHSSSMPYAFTEHGALMAANILSSERASAMSVYLIRAFVKRIFNGQAGNISPSKVPLIIPMK